MSGATLPRGRLIVDPSVFLAPGAVVCGEVRIGAHSSVWFHTVLRGDSDAIEIGAGTSVQDLTMVHVDEGCPARIGDRVTIGHRAIIHGCVIEDDCLVGMGAIVLSGARIGAGSLIGAGALVRERQVIPPGSLVLGAPARVAGEVQPAHREAIARGASHYAALARDYLAQGLGQTIPPPAGGAWGGGTR
jgi:carbonic anhydrase/acetyltransferase-like protein (isoleucine patch superfamily)